MVLPIAFYIIVLIFGLDVHEVRDAGWIFPLVESDTPFWHFYTYYDFRLVDWRAVAETIPAMLALTFFGNVIQEDYLVFTFTKQSHSYFKQVYSYKPNPFEAVIENKDSGYILVDSLIALSKETISMIRGHEFQHIILEVDKRYHDFERPGTAEIKGKKVYWIKAKDELNNTCSLFFDPKMGLLSAIHFQNPADLNEVIEIEFSNWQQHL